jgi:hypothetical protein
MKNYHRLALPTNLFKNTEFLKPKKYASGYTVTQNYQELLSDDLLSVFQSLNLKIKCIIVFSVNDSSTSPEHRMVHSDVYFENNVWNPYTCGINWEINNTTNKIMWWDTKDAPAIPPHIMEKYHPVFKRLAGIHYGDRRVQFGEGNYKKLDEVNIKNQPVLIRTNIPHSTVYHSETDLRVSVSIRFEEHWDTWEQAVEIFKPLIVGSELDG